MYSCKLYRAYLKSLANQLFIPTHKKILKYSQFRHNATYRKHLYTVQNYVIRTIRLMRNMRLGNNIQKPYWSYTKYGLLTKKAPIKFHTCPFTPTHSARGGSAWPSPLAGSQDGTFLHHMSIILLKFFLILMLINS